MTFGSCLSRLLGCSNSKNSRPEGYDASKPPGCTQTAVQSSGSNLLRAWQMINALYRTSLADSERLVGRDARFGYCSSTDAMVAKSSSSVSERMSMSTKLLWLP